MAVLMEVYRLLRTDENPAIGLFAKARNHQSSVVLHVAYGSNNQSRFISACGSLQCAINFRANNQKNNGPIVKISITEGMTFFDLRTPDQRQHILVTENVNGPPETINMFHNFAASFQEVLIVDQVPAGNIVVLNV